MERERGKGRARTSVVRVADASGQGVALCLARGLGRAALALRVYLVVRAPVSTTGSGAPLGVEDRGIYGGVNGGSFRTAIRFKYKGIQSGASATRPTQRQRSSNGSISQIEILPTSFARNAGGRQTCGDKRCRGAHRAVNATTKAKAKAKRAVPRGMVGASRTGG